MLTGLDDAAREAAPLRPAGAPAQRPRSYLAAGVASGGAAPPQVHWQRPRRQTVVGVPGQGRVGMQGMGEPHPAVNRDTAASKRAWPGLRLFSAYSLHWYHRRLHCASPSQVAASCRAWLTAWCWDAQSAGSVVPEVASGRRAGRSRRAGAASAVARGATLAGGPGAGRTRGGASGRGREPEEQPVQRRLPTRQGSHGQEEGGMAQPWHSAAPVSNPRRPLSPG